MRRRMLLFLLLLCCVFLVWGGAMCRSAQQSQAARLPGGGSAAMGLMLLEDENGLYVLAVSEKSSAWRSGVEPGDRLLVMNGTALQSVTQLDEMLQCAAGEITFTLLRDGVEMQLPLNGR